MLQERIIEMNRRNSDEGIFLQLTRRTLLLQKQAFTIWRKIRGRKHALKDQRILHMETYPFLEARQGREKQRYDGETRLVTGWEGNSEGSND